MNDKISVFIKSILDKTSLTKTFNAIQSFFNQKNLQLNPKIDTKQVQKQVQTTVEQTEKQLAQKQNKISGRASSSQIAEASSVKSGNKKITTSASPPKTTSNNRGGLIRLYHSFPFLATAGFSSDAYETCH